ncbi:hypothetical protein ABT390_25385 [Streptomyces aurantiacus]|uniref:DUF8017 domain-containing protein n=1 Tax=Streptomyces aurantiacus JA 4570 TaxID=1286094 RepID=S3ZUD8_9ACTN|nr:hypothetical protein [Streptomyces aurantiacus]EPH46793.1 hypothetical protein STRAU_0206 [Streptomyces aurantiacus JA 4570]
MNPQDQNPYRQPGYQQANPYLQPPEGGGSGGNRTAAIAVIAAAAVVVAAGVTGFVLLGGDEDDSAKPGPARSSASPTPADADRRRTDGGPKPTVPGWKAVMNPKRGVAFDVPPQWSPKSVHWVSWVSDDAGPEDNKLAAMAAPAYLKEQWCAFDEDKDGTSEYAPLGGAGTRINRGAKNTEDIARESSTAWVYGAYAQPEKKKVKAGAVESYTTKSGIKGSLATAESSGVTKKGKCDTDGKATVFAFKDAGGEFVSWAFHGAKDVKEEIPDATVRKILSTVREYRASDEN